MGYSTDFSGVLSFVQPLTSNERVSLDEILEQDARDHPEWGNTDVTNIDLCVNQEHTGVEWNGAEKTYDMDEIINNEYRDWLADNAAI